MTAAVHLTLAGTPGPSPHSRIISGPNVKIAMLRALAQRAAATAPIVWQWVKRGAALVARTPGWIGHATLGVLSTPAGYSAATQLVGAGVKTCWRLLDRAACLVGRGIATVTGLAASSVRHIAPTLGQAFVAAHADAVDAVNALHEQVVKRVSSLGQQVERLAQYSLVKTTATRTAAAASGLLALHLVTRGLLASQALLVAPSLAGLVVALTSPWWLLAAVMGVTIGTIMAVAYLEAGSAEAPDDLVLHVDVDGSIRIQGVPRGLSKTEENVIASESSRLAQEYLQSQAKVAAPGKLRRSTSRRGGYST